MAADCAGGHKARSYNELTVSKKEMRYGPEVVTQGDWFSERKEIGAARQAPHFGILPGRTVLVGVTLGAYV
jgi:hypothetical protein